MPKGEHARFKNKTGTFYIRGVPKTLRDKFHAHCVSRNQTMTDKIIELVRGVLEAEERILRRGEENAE
jgi:hypothetical protein